MDDLLAVRTSPICSLCGQTIMEGDLVVHALTHRPAHESCARAWCIKRICSVLSSIFL